MGERIVQMVGHCGKDGEKVVGLGRRECRTECSRGKKLG